MSRTRRALVPASAMMIAMAMMMATVTACGPHAADGTPPATTRLMASRSHLDASDSGVGIVAEGCSVVARLASGVILEHPERTGGSGLVVTVAHAIAGATTITVVDAEGVEHQATVVAFDADADLAALRVTDLSSPALRSAPVTVGAGITLSWNRSDGVTAEEVDVVKRLDITIEDIYTEGNTRRSGIEIVGDITVGDSGGPVLDSTGDVIGIVYGSSRTRRGVGFATDTTEIEQVLRSVSTDADSGIVSNGRCS